jgi:hypothetical protein
LLSLNLGHPLVLIHSTGLRRSLLVIGAGEFLLKERRSKLEGNFAFVFNGLEFEVRNCCLFGKQQLSSPENQI